MSNVRPSSHSCKIKIPASVDALFRWHQSVSSYVRSFPSSEKIKLLSSEEPEGGQTHFCLETRRKSRYVLRQILSRDHNLVKVKMDVGDFRYFEHQSRFSKVDEEQTELSEKIEFTLRSPWFFREHREKKYRRRFENFFRHKHDTLIKDLQLFEEHPFTKPLKVLITGSTGLVGSRLFHFLQVAGHEVWMLVRSHDQEGERSIYYNTHSGEVDRSKIEGFDAVINLWGHSVQGRWTKKNKRKILKSRRELTQTMSRVFMGLQNPPKVFLCASAVGFYGDRGNEELTEESAKGKDSFLAEIASAWEEACHLMQTRGIRVVNLRFGVILSLGGGAFSKMLPIFKLGLGGPLGLGDQYMSWISMDDALGAIYHAMTHEEIVGPINVTAPKPVTNREFTRSLVAQLKKPAIFRVPAFALRWARGQMADELLLSSTRAVPQKLLESGYVFRYPDIQSALSHLIDS